MSLGRGERRNGDFVLRARDLRRDLEKGVLSAAWDAQRMGILWGTLRRCLDMWSGLEAGLWQPWVDGWSEGRERDSEQSRMTRDPRLSHPDV